MCAAFSFSPWHSNQSSLLSIEGKEKTHSLPEGAFPVVAQELTRRQFQNDSAESKHEANVASKALSNVLVRYVGNRLHAEG
jgi:hypothetical protein